MDCETAREHYVATLATGQAPPARVGRHLASCPACGEEVESLAATWTVLAALPLVEPSPDVGRRLRRRVGWTAASETLTSVECWQQAALAGVAGFLLLLLLSLLVPFHTIVVVFREIVPSVMRPPASYLLVGLLYGVVPMMIGTAFQPPRAALPGLLGAVEAPVVLFTVLVPFVVTECRNYPLALLAACVGGIAAGAVAGGMAGSWLGRRYGVRGTGRVSASALSS
jgi:predicted anti-sigma-YlaC factor YlaD